VLDFVYALPWHPNDIAAAFTVTFNVSGDIGIPHLSVSVEGGRIVIEESTSHSGGLSVYGRNSGCYPMDLTVLIK
jgi:predicted transcriptional regulator